MNRYRLRSREEIKQSWKEMREVAPTVRSYHIGEWLLYSSLLSAVVVVLGILFQIHVALGAIVMGSVLISPLVRFFYKRRKKND